MEQHGSTDGITGSRLLALRRTVYGPNATLSYRQPIAMDSAEGCVMLDDEGRAYLDCVNNVAHVGHGNPRVAAAVSEQLQRLNTNARYLSPELVAYCQELTATMPEPLEVVYLTNSGSEANDLALRIASAAAGAAHAHAAAGTAAAGPEGRCHVAVMSGAYHGHLSSLIPLSSYKFWGPGGGGREPWVHVIPSPDTYRGRNLDGAAAARAALAEASAAGGRLVAFFCESLISCGGQLLLPPGYLAAVYRVMKAAGVVCVADEVQTGFGRVGEAFWAFQLQHGACPDVVTLGKPMGNGFPIGGLVTTRALASAFAGPGMEHFNTFAGSNAAVAAGRAVLRELRKRRLQEHAADVGGHLLRGLRELQADFPAVVGDARGVGLFLGIEVVRDAAAKAPAPLLARALVEGAKASGVLLSTDGPAGNVIKIKPPLVFGRGEADRLLAVLRDVLSDLVCQLPELLAVEEQHWQQRMVPLLRPYADNEVAVTRVMHKLAGEAAAAGECGAVALHGLASGCGDASASLGEDCDAASSASSADVEVVIGGGPRRASA